MSGPNMPAYVGTGAASNDMDADDCPASNGSADGHADCVPTGNSPWPGQDEDSDNTAHE